MEVSVFVSEGIAICQRSGLPRRKSFNDMLELQKPDNFRTGFEVDPED
jgi:hypothetical protein